MAIFGPVFTLKRFLYLAFATDWGIDTLPGTRLAIMPSSSRDKIAL